MNTQQADFLNAEYSVEIKLPLQKKLDHIEKQIAASERTAIASIIEIGRLLVEAKELCIHGEFRTWINSISQRSSINIRTAQRYMEIYREFGDMELLNITSSYALQLIAKAPDDIKSEFKQKIAQGENPQPADIRAAVKEAATPERDPNTVDWTYNHEKAQAQLNQAFYDGIKSGEEKEKEWWINEKLTEIKDICENKSYKNKDKILEIGIVLKLFKSRSSDEDYKKLCQLIMKNIPKWNLKEFDVLQITKHGLDNLIAIYDDYNHKTDEDEDNDYIDNSLKEADEQAQQRQRDQAFLKELENKNRKALQDDYNAALARIKELEVENNGLKYKLEQANQAWENWQEEQRKQVRTEAENEQLKTENEKLKSQIAEMEIVLTKQGEQISWFEDATEYNNWYLETLVEKMNEKSFQAEKWEKTATALMFKLHSMQLAADMPRLALPAPERKNDTSVVFEPTEQQLKALELKQQGLGQREIAKQLNVGRSTVYHWFKELC